MGRDKFRRSKHNLINIPAPVRLAAEILLSVAAVAAIAYFAQQQSGSSIPDLRPDPLDPAKVRLNFDERFSPAQQRQLLDAIMSQGGAMIADEVPVVDNPQLRAVVNAAYQPCRQPTAADPLYFNFYAADAWYNSQEESRLTGFVDPTQPKTINIRAAEVGNDGTIILNQAQQIISTGAHEFAHTNFCHQSNPTNFFPGEQRVENIVEGFSVDVLEMDQCRLTLLAKNGNQFKNGLILRAGEVFQNSWLEEAAANAKMYRNTYNPVDKRVKGGNLVHPYDNIVIRSLLDFQKANADMSVNDTAAIFQTACQSKAGNPFTVIADSAQAIGGDAVFSKDITNRELARAIWEEYTALP